MSTTFNEKGMGGELPRTEVPEENLTDDLFESQSQSELINGDVPMRDSAPEETNCFARIRNIVRQQLRRIWLRLQTRLGVILEPV